MKSVMRQACKKRRLAVSEKVRKDEAIFRRLVASEYYRNSQNIMTYVSLPSEVDTHRFIHHALKEDKHLYVPKVISKTEMTLCRLYRFEDLKPGVKGILEPEGFELADAQLMDLILVPALGYDFRGYRIGYGGGYYDRLLAHVNDGIAIGLCYEACMYDDLPIEPHDMPVGAILTEEREIKIWGMTT